MKYVKLIALMLLLFLPGILKGQPWVINRSTDYVNDDFFGSGTVKPGDTIWIQSGIRGELKVLNFHGLSGNPIVFANRGGQVIIETNSNYGISFSGCSDFKLSGLPGNGYQYGIRIARVTNESGMGISVTDRSTDFEIENCEVSNTGFAGIMAKTDPDCNDPHTYRDAFTQYNTLIHDCYIHDVAAEGLYIGNTSYEGYYSPVCNKVLWPSVLAGTWIYHNRVERTGWDGIQVSSAVRDCEIHHNVLIDCSYRMTTNQMSGIIIGGGTQAKCYNNKILDSYGTGILVFGKGGTEVYNNLIIRPGKRYFPGDQTQPEHGIFLSDKTNDEKTFYGVYNNTIIQPKSDGVRIDNTVNFEVRIYNNALIDPGAFDYYENDNTGWTGPDSYIFDLGKLGLYKSLNNFKERALSDGGFVQAPADDYHLSAGSRMIDTGLDITLSGVTNDLDDHIRPVGDGFDIGAYEYFTSQSISENPSPPDFTVSSVRVGQDHQLIIDLQGDRSMNLRVSLRDLLGRFVYQEQNLGIGQGNNTFSMPCRAGGILILSIQSDRLSYVRKIIIL